MAEPKEAETEPALPAIELTTRDLSLWDEIALEIHKTPAGKWSAEVHELTQPPLEIASGLKSEEECWLAFAREMEHRAERAKRRAEEEQKAAEAEPDAWSK